MYYLLMSCNFEIKYCLNYIGKKIQVTKDKSIEADPKTRIQLFLSCVVSKPFFGVYDQDVIEAAYALTATNKTL